MALVQTPQDFYNVTSFEHGSGIAYGEPFHEQTLFYRLLQPGKNRWNAAFWCGTSALVRAEALRAVGGAATDTITEDIHTTIRFHRAGWRTVYHNEVLARGLAADDVGQYQLQRNRWGTGAMQVLRIENPLIVRGLTLGQRLAYAATLLGWFDSWRTLGFLALPPLVLISGQIPIIADGLTFAVAFGVTYGLQQAALYLLGRGAYRPILSIVFDLVRVSPNFLATLTLFSSRTPRFRVTPKGRMAANRGRIEAPVMLRAAFAACFVGATVYVLHLLGVFSITYVSEWAAAGAFFWLVVNAALVWIAARRVRSLRFAAERRSAVRFGRYRRHGRWGGRIHPGRLGGWRPGGHPRTPRGARDAPPQLRAAGRHEPRSWPASVRPVGRRVASITTRSSSSPGSSPPRARWPGPSSGADIRSPAP